MILFREWMTEYIMVYIIEPRQLDQLFSLYTRYMIGLLTGHLEVIMELDVVQE